jgi:hypothetical protein
MRASSPGHMLLLVASVNGWQPEPLASEPFITLCSDFAHGPDGEGLQACQPLDLGVCNRSTYDNCDCLVVEPNQATSNTTRNELLNASTPQAMIQLTLSACSLLLGITYLICALCMPELRQWPSRLIFWSQVYELFVSAQMGTVSALYLVADFTGYGRNQAWPITSYAPCLCAFSVHTPGCACSGGVLSFVLQAGLVGSVAYYFCLVHNLYCSVSDPFTKPQTRAKKYHALCLVAVSVLSVWYLLPDALNSRFVGYGYKPAFITCWSPLRYGDEFINNPQTMMTIFAPIGVVWLSGPLLHCFARMRLKRGGSSTRELLETRQRQLEQGNIFSTVFGVYWCPCRRPRTRHAHAPCAHTPRARASRAHAARTRRTHTPHAHAARTRRTHTPHAHAVRTRRRQRRGVARPLRGAARHAYS